MAVDLVSDLQAGDESGLVPAVSANVNNVPASAVGSPEGVLRAGEQPRIDGNAPAPDATKTPSIRDLLSNAYKGEDGSSVAQADAQTNTGQPRDANGQFAGKPAAAPVDGAVVPPATEGAPVNVQAPKGMSHEDFQTFTALPAEMQQFVARTMEAVNTQAERHASFEDMRSRLIEPRREAWAINGMSETQALTQLFALSDFASQRPVDFLQWFAGQQNINLGALASATPQPQADPVTADLYRRVQELQGQVQGFHSERQQTETAQVVSQIQSFADEKDAAGNALRPYFQELGEGLRPYVADVKDKFPAWSPAQILQEAYDRACWATPTIRTKLQEAEQAKRLTEQSARTARARAAGSSVTGAPANGASHASSQHDGSIRGILSEQFASAAGSV